jgi:hypothetical protein
MKSKSIYVMLVIILMLLFLILGICLVVRLNNPEFELVATVFSVNRP